MNCKSQAFCLFCEYFSAQVHSLYTPKECNICDEMHLELLWCENCSRCACLECYRQEALDADYNNRNAEESESRSVGSAVFCLDCGLSTAYFVPLAHQTQCSECDSGFREMIWCESCRHPARSPIPLSAQGSGVEKGRWVGRVGTHLLAWSSAVTWPRSGHERWRSCVRGRGGVVGLRLAFPMRVLASDFQRQFCPTAAHVGQVFFLRNVEMLAPHVFR